MEKLLCGADLGGTKLSVGLVRRDGSLLDKETVYDHADKTEGQTVDAIGACLDSLLERRGLGKENLLGLGVGFAGHLRFKQGVVITTSNFRNFKMKNYPLRDEIQKRVGLRVVLDNDANAQGFAEYSFGAGRDFPGIIFLTISTGIGAGIILDGKVYRGMTGTAGEVGHTIVNPQSDIRCGCGNYGCLMSHACGLSLPRLVEKKLAAGMETTLPLDGANLRGTIDGRWIGRGLERNDPLCLQVVQECADYIGIGLYNLFQIFNPPAFVLGGGLLHWGDIYLGRIVDKFYALAGDMLYDDIAIRTAALGDEAGLVGAAALLLEDE